MGQKNFGQKFLEPEILVQNHFGVNKFWGQKIFWVKKILVKKIWVKFFSYIYKKKTGWDNPRGRIYEPSHPDQPDPTTEMLLFSPF